MIAHRVTGLWCYRRAPPTGKIYKTQDGGLVAENLIPGVREDGMLDALTQSLDVVVPQVKQEDRKSVV